MKKNLYIINGKMVMAFSLQEALNTVNKATATKPAKA